MICLSSAGTLASLEIPVLQNVELILSVSSKCFSNDFPSKSKGPPILGVCEIEVLLRWSGVIRVWAILKKACHLVAQLAFRDYDDQAVLVASLIALWCVLYRYESLVIHRKDAFYFLSSFFSF